ncbi:formate dehydrogenase subunit gamma [Salinarimonas sp. NSM]|uniref:formate dehydrogenase subunit gamma n=1 Tax=Salinarimonas sp. NSM TaxID=3458003 RepID=UPI004037299E
MRRTTRSPSPSAAHGLLARLAGVLLLAALLLAPVLGAAQEGEPQPEAFPAERGVYLNPERAPTGDLDTLLRTLSDREMPEERLEGFTSYQNPALGFVTAPDNRVWRDFRTYWTKWIHGILIVLAVAAVLGLFVWRGSQGYDRDPQGRRVPRFRFLDRVVHWTTAISFVLLALTGLNLVFGRQLIQPWAGDAAFGALSQGALLVHNQVGFAFLLGIMAMAGLWVQDNLFNRVDREWLRRAGGLPSGRHVPAEKFNAGQKLIFWISILGGLALGVSGILLMLPISTIGMGWMQVLHGGHTIVAALMIATIIGHAYLGSVGVSGSFDAMWRGDVDRQWARTHHPLWIERLERGRAASAEPETPPRAEPAEQETAR